VDSSDAFDQWIEIIEVGFEVEADFPFEQATLAIE